MSCTIRFDTDLYDTPVDDYFNLVPAVHKTIEGNKVTYRFFNYHGYLVVVDQALKEISVYCEKDVVITQYGKLSGMDQNWTRSRREMRMVKQDPKSFDLDDITADNIMKPIAAMVRDYVRAHLEHDIGLRGGKIQNLNIDYTLPYALTSRVKKAMWTRNRRGQELDIFQAITSKGFYDRAKAFYRQIPSVRYSDMTLEFTNFYWAHEQEIEEIREKFPRLYTHLGDYYRRGWSEELFCYQHGILVRNDNNHSLGQPPADWHRRRKSLITDLRNFVMRKFSLTKSELNEWLTIDDQKFRWINKEGERMGHGIALQVIREVGRTPAMTGLDRLDAFYCEVHRNAADKNFLRQLLTEALKNSIKRRHRMGIHQWLELEWAQVADWFRNQGANFRPDKNQKNAKWSWFVRHSEEWHDREAIAKMTTKDPMATWTSLLPQHAIGEFIFVPMLSDHDLIVEGESQVHCVGGPSYISGSAAGAMLIWSIRTRDNNRVATLQLHREQVNVEYDDVIGDKIVRAQAVKSSWERGQCLGKRNSKVETPTSNAADDLIKRYNLKFMETFDVEREAAQERVKDFKYVAAQERRNQAKLAARIEKLMREEGMTRIDARTVAVQQLADEAAAKAIKEREKADAARRHLDKSERIILRIDEMEGDETPPATADADVDQVFAEDEVLVNPALGEYLSEVTNVDLGDGNVIEGPVGLYLVNDPHEPGEPDPNPDPLPEVVADLEPVEEEAPPQEALNGLGDLEARLEQALAEAFDELLPVLDAPHPIEVAA